MVVRVIVENDGHLVGRDLQSVAQSSTIKKNNPATEISALNDLSFKPKPYLTSKNVFLKLCRPRDLSTLDN